MAPQGAKGPIYGEKPLSSGSPISRETQSVFKIMYFEGPQPVLRKLEFE